VGAGTRPRPPRQDGLDTRHPGWRARAGGLLGLPGARVAGCAAIPEPERPRRRRSNRIHLTARTRVPDPHAAAAPRALSRDGRLPTQIKLSTSNPRTLRSSAAARSRSSTPGDGRWHDRPAIPRPGGHDALVGGVSGPFRAAVGSACGAVLTLPSVRFRRPPARTVHATRRRTRLSVCRAH
jgi:hypothetical protein